MKRRILVSIMLVLILVLLSGMTFASHISHYTILNWWNYDAYEYNSSGKIYIDYIYQENGTHNWSGAIDKAFDNLRSDGYSFFIFNEVSSNYELNIISYDWGETSWVGIAGANNPKTIRLNDWFEDDNNTDGEYADYDYTELVRVVLHEFLHTAGVGHYGDCADEVMSNADGKDLQRTHLNGGDKAGLNYIY